MKKIKLLYLTDEILIENNAPTIHVLEICKNLKKLGLNITLFLPSLSHVKIKNIDTKYIFMTKHLKSIIFHPLLLIYLARYLYKNRDAIIYIRYFPLLFLPIFFCRLFNIPCIVEVNGKIPEETKLLKNPLLAKIYTVLDRINFNNSTKIITVTEGLKKYIKSKYAINAHKISVIKNGVDTNLFKPFNKKLARKKTSLKLNQTYIGYIGSLYEYQGLSYIIKCAKIVNSKIPNTRFIIVGNGTQSERKKILNHIKDLELENIIKVIGPISHNKVVDYINSFDICLCYPTKFRNNSTSPFKLFEYLACNKAVITSDITGLRDIFKDCIFYAKPNNDNNLTKKIIELLLNKKTKTLLEKKGRKFILNEYTWEDTTRKITDILIREIIPNKTNIINYEK